MSITAAPMRDVWFSECEPCGLSSHFGTQAEAIASAEDHNLATHRGLPEGQRGRGFLACVQQRTITPAAVPPAATPATAPDTVAPATMEQ